MLYALEKDSMTPPPPPPRPHHILCLFQCLTDVKTSFRLRLTNSNKDLPLAAVRTTCTVNIQLQQRTQGARVQGRHHQTVRGRHRQRLQRASGSRRRRGLRHCQSRRLLLGGRRSRLHPETRPLKTTEVAVTTGGSLPCKKVLHAVGPRWYDYTDKGMCQQHLVDTVYNCLLKAESLGFTSIALPSISSGVVSTQF